ncbi:hypothetical protein GHT06_020189 [Daphnia sinensis]|uniref:Uncharacterized protein n=1 Tax=Daphnia sinensis TaxID=1820382 RepID=A0AAD5PS38_9CRUS|nr:hypothetical protein GHT06_020189 [Daphnia sinensis]
MTSSMHVAREPPKSVIDISNSISWNSILRSSSKSHCLSFGSGNIKSFTLTGDLKSPNLTQIFLTMLLLNFKLQPTNPVILYISVPSQKWRILVISIE